MVLENPHFALIATMQTLLFVLAALVVGGMGWVAAHIPVRRTAVRMDGTFEPHPRGKVFAIAC